MTSPLPHDIAGLALMVFLLGAELPIGFGLAFAVAASYIVAIRLARTSAA
jgi:hypothetical protein